jgi:hypothetical protein
MPTPATKKKKAEKVEQPKVDQSFTCDFCKRSYHREQSFLVHLCEQKRRFLAQDERPVKLAFWIYQRFYEVNYRVKKPKTYDQFAASKWYVSFVKFARYLLDINAVNPQAFVTFLIKAGVALDRWQSPVIYNAYIRELNKKESPDAAVERNILLMESWALERGTCWTDFFRLVEPPLATAWIQSGRISPWLLYTASSARVLFERLSEEQIALIQDTIDPDFWRVRMNEEKEEVARLCSILDEAGL